VGVAVEPHSHTTCVVPLFADLAARCMHDGFVPSIDSISSLTRTPPD
jgi:hypothetical protein